MQKELKPKGLAKVWREVKRPFRQIWEQIKTIIEKNSDPLPSHVRLEACTLCQLNCTSCFMRRDKTVTVGNGYLKFCDFKNFIDKNSFVKTVELANNGEIFLNPELMDIIKYAHENGIALRASGGVNFNMVSDEMLEALAQYKFELLSFSIDGASQEVYAQYRRNGDFDRVISNISKLIKYKKKHNSKLPKLKWQYVLMNHNERDVPKAKVIAKKLGIPMIFKLTWDKNYVPNDPEMLKRETGLEHLSREEFANSNKQDYVSHVCHQLWDMPTINWDGRLLGCCCLVRDDFGINVFEVGLKKALKSKKYRNAKKILCGGKISKSIDHPCVKCARYKMMVKHNSFLKR